MKKWILALLEGIRFYFGHIERGWWKKKPYLPLPPKKFVEFRLGTAYGLPENGWPRPPLLQLVVDTKRFLLWRRELRLDRERQRKRRNG